MNKKELRQRILDKMNSRRIDGKTYIDSEWLLNQYDEAERQKREEGVELGKREQVEYIENTRDHDSCECDNCHRWRKFKRNWDKRCKKMDNTQPNNQK